MPRIGLPLAPTLQKRIVDSVAAGATYEIAAQAAGISRRSITRYMERGRAADAAVAEWLDSTLEPARSGIEDLPDETQIDVLAQGALPEGERSYWRFWLVLMRARAEAAERRVGSIAEAGFGYEARETRTVEKQVLGKDGQVVSLTETTTIVRFERDWRAEAWWLECQEREAFGRRRAVELTGAGGGPVAHTVEDVASKRARALEVLDQVAEKRRQREESAARAAGVEPAVEDVSG